VGGVGDIRVSFTTRDECLHWRTELNGVNWTNAGDGDQISFLTCVQVS
jgi:hypothetical protein